MFVKKIYTKELGASVGLAAKTNNPRKYHVILGEGKNWAVVADGKIRAIKVFSSRLGAINFAKETASKIKGEVVIHKETGEIEDRVSLHK